jgi:putative transposase
MARNPRVVLPGYAYHLTQRGTNRQPVFRTAGDRKVYLKLLAEQLAESSVRLISFCLMPNHVHFIAVPQYGDSLSVWMRRVNGRYAQYFNAKAGRTGHFWQARFFSCALSPKHLTHALRYVEQNPVRANLVAKAADYRWSSASAHLTGKLGFLDTVEWHSRGGAAGWAELLNSTPQQPLVHLLRRCTYGGRPFGGGEFIKEIEGRLPGKHWKRWPYVQELRDEAILLDLESIDGKHASFGA